MRIEQLFGENGEYRCPKHGCRWYASHCSHLIDLMASECNPRYAKSVQEGEVLMKVEENRLEE